MHNLTAIKRRKVQDLAGLKANSEHESRETAHKLIAEARTHGVSLRDFLDLAVDVRSSDKPEAFRDDKGFLSGYEATLAFLNLPVRNDFSHGIVLEAATDTFATFPGSRALFPYVVDDVVQWKYREVNFENIGALVGNSRTVAGPEILTTVVDDKKEDYQVWQAVAEGARVPVRTIRATERTVGFFKHGGGLRITYEFQRRASIDLLTPYNARMKREAERSKVAHAVSVLVNGDGVHSPATEINQSSYNSAVGSNSTNGKISWEHFTHFLIARARAGVPVDTVVGNWDAYIQWLMLFAKPTTGNSTSDVDLMARTGFQIGGIPILTGVVNFALASDAPANKLLCFSRADTLEELIEGGSLIDESERSIQNQVITYVKTENSGYRIVFGDTRALYNFGA